MLSDDRRYRLPFAGDSSSAGLLKKWCGTDKTVLHSTGQNIFLQFVSNRLVQRKGFVIKYRAVTPCEKPICSTLACHGCLFDLSADCLCFSVPAWLSFCLICQSILSLSVCVSLSLSVCLCICLFDSLAVSVSACLSVCLSVCLCLSVSCLALLFDLSLSLSEHVLCVRHYNSVATRSYYEYHKLLQLSALKYVWDVHSQSKKHSPAEHCRGQPVYAVAHRQMHSLEWEDYVCDRFFVTCFMGSRTPSSEDKLR